MDTVGVRDLKANLSRHLKRVRAGTRLLVTDRGRSIATIVPVAQPTDQAWLHRLVAEGKVHWNGQKSRVPKKGVPATGKRLTSDIVLEDRR
jgi:prevent-host-death family protein